jgi:hypothetical protein
MKLRKLLIVLAVIFLINPELAIAQQKKLRVFVSGTSQDSVGQQFLYEIREKLDASSHLAQGDSDDQSLFQLRVVTLNPYSDSPYGQQMTVYSIVLTGSFLDGHSGKLFLDQWVGTCGVTRVSECAASIVASADNDMTP